MYPDKAHVIRKKSGYNPIPLLRRATHSILISLCFMFYLSFLMYCIGQAGWWLEAREEMAEDRSERHSW